MAFRLAVQRAVGGYNGSATLASRRWFHVAAVPPPFDGCLPPPTASSPPLVLPETYPNPDSNNNGFGFPSFSIGGSMELMGVPRRKVMQKMVLIMNNGRLFSGKSH